MMIVPFSLDVASATDIGAAKSVVLSQASSTGDVPGLFIRSGDGEGIYIDKKGSSELQKPRTPSFEDLCVRELQTMGAHLSSVAVARTACNWAARIQRYAGPGLLKAANVAIGADGEPVFEWWRGSKKLTLYVGKDAAEFVKVWGPSVDTEMEDGTISSGLAFAPLWQWLTT